MAGSSSMMRVVSAGGEISGGNMPFLIGPGEEKRFAGAGELLVGLKKGLEDVLAFGAGEADAVVRNGEGDGVRCGAGAEGDALVVAGVLERVFEEVGQDGEEPVAVGGEFGERFDDI